MNYSAASRIMLTLNRRAGRFYTHLTQRLHDYLSTSWQPQLPKENKINHSLTSNTEPWFEKRNYITTSKDVYEHCNTRF